MSRYVKGVLGAVMASAMLMASSASAGDNVGPWQVTPIGGIPFFAGVKIAAVFPGVTSSTSLNYTNDTWHHADALCTNAFGNVVATDAWRYGAVAGTVWSTAVCPAGRLNTFGRVHIWT